MYLEKTLSVVIAALQKILNEPNSSNDVIIKVINVLEKILNDPLKTTESDFLKDRIHYLEEIHKKINDALEIAVEFNTNQTSLNRISDLGFIFDHTKECVEKLLPMKMCGFYLIDETDHDFYLYRDYPQNSEKELDVYINTTVENKLFGLAIRDNKYMPCRVNGTKVILHSMSTISRVRGIFIGIPEDQTDHNPDFIDKHMAIIMQKTADSIESFALYKMLAEKNEELVKKIEEGISKLDTVTRYDQITGLLTRKSLQDALCTGLQQINATGIYFDSFKNIVFMLIDINRFKEVNEAIGQSAGDILLKEFGNRLTSCFHEDAYIARLAGDEFAVFLMTENKQREILDLTQRLCRAIDRPFYIGEDLTIDLSASIGIALSPEHGIEPEIVWKRAGLAMYEVKKKKYIDTKAEIYQPIDERPALDRMTLLSDLRKGIDKGELFLLFQPKLHLESMKICGAESLVRWKSPTRGLVMPSEFIPLAEKTGLVKELTLNIIDMAISHILNWRELGLEIPLAVNVSALNLSDPNFSRQVIDILSRYGGLNGCLLEFEITESAIMQAPETAISTMKILTDKNISFSIDDFGTGYSSFTYLKNLPVKYLKIDYSFVNDLLKDPRNKCIVKSILDVGHGFGLKVVAEGIEDEITSNVLKDIKCDIGQGYFFGKPMAEKDFLREVYKRDIHKI